MQRCTGNPAYQDWPYCARLGDVRCPKSVKGLVGLRLSSPRTSYSAAADTVCVVVRGMIVQSTVDASVRGRLSAVDHIVDIAGPELGNVRAGGVAQLANSGSALAVDPITSLIGTVLLACISMDLRKYTVTTAAAKEPPRK